MRRDSGPGPSSRVCSCAYQQVLARGPVRPKPRQLANSRDVLRIILFRGARGGARGKYVAPAARTIGPRSHKSVALKTSYVFRIRRLPGNNSLATGCFDGPATEKRHAL